MERLEKRLTVKGLADSLHKEAREEVPSLYQPDEGGLQKRLMSVNAPGGNLTGAKAPSKR